MTEVYGSFTDRTTGLEMERQSFTDTDRTNDCYTDY